MMNSTRQFTHGTFVRAACLDVPRTTDKLAETAGMVQAVERRQAAWSIVEQFRYDEANWIPDNNDTNLFV